MIEGACHCGAVRWSLDALPGEATACNCTVCRRYGTLWAYGFENEEIRISGETRIYAWGGRNLGFHFCGDCGCVAAWWAMNKGADGRRYGAVNLRLAQPDCDAAIPIRHHEGLETGKDLPHDGRRVADMWF
ncbi:MAG TPA: GFA family protein [Caulobacteraceae bacterium]|nr:GFA family protein [Caulobacteraceae bacterium]